MKLPVKITPDPLISSSVEIRFQLKDFNINIVSALLPLYIEELPVVETLPSLPAEIILQNPEFVFRAQVRLKNDDYILSFGNNSFLIETTKAYPLWSNFSQFIYKQLEKFFKLDLVYTVFRIGLRYINVFNQRTVKDILNFIPTISLSGYEESIINSKIGLKKNDIQLSLTIAENARIQKTNETLTGAYIDIDAFHDSQLSTFADVFAYIEKLHQVEKELFFTLIKPEFLQQLKPEYGE